MIKMKNAGVKMVFEPTQQGAYISTMAQENKQEGLNALLVSGAQRLRGRLRPGLGRQRDARQHRVTALYMGQDAKVGPGRGHLRQVGQEGRPADPARPLHALRVDQRRAVRPGAQGRREPNPTRASLDAQLDKITSFNASGLISTQDPAQKIPGQCWIVAQYENGTWKRIPPDPKSGFVCNPGGFYPSSYKGISR